MTNGGGPYHEDKRSQIKVEEVAEELPMKVKLATAEKPRKSSKPNAERESRERRKAEKR